MLFQPNIYRTPELGCKAPKCQETLSRTLTYPARSFFINLLLLRIGEKRCPSYLTVDHVARHIVPEQTPNTAQSLMGNIAGYVTCADPKCQGKLSRTLI